ncbi:aminotransferase-like domain-containing protein [Marinobacterium jannaschii]|uniref:aminotransferase-like domain-containing protein n=1 Tax=Marinobacterium jannaschii TaxID=64970 RepID=UPI00048353BB|nr:PLP-dependent aminotransferase family protein [Marinobacterium jannaschii]
MKKYQQLAQSIQQQIEKQQLRPGDALPSIRLLSESRQVSRNTAIRAYNLLEDLGLIEPRLRRGYFVRRRITNGSNLKPRSVKLGSLPLRIIHDASLPELIPLGSANPAGSFPARARFYNELARQARREAARSCRLSPYIATPGDAGLRQQLARRYSDYMKLEADDVIVTSGAQEAVSLALRAVAQPGDTVIVESPSFYGTLQCIEALGLKALEIPSDPGSGISLPLLQQALESWPVSAIMLNPGFNNPLGFCMPEENRRKLLEITATYDLPVIEDDVFGDLQHQGTRVLPIKAFDSDGRVILCSSLSKTLDAATRLGWTLPGRYYEKINYLKYVTSMASNGTAQLAAAEFLSGRHYERHLRSIRRTYRQRRELMLEQLDKCWPRESVIYSGEGGYLCWIQLPYHLDGEVLFHQARQAGISITPGSLFSSSGQYQNYIRLNYASYAEDALFPAAVSTLAGLISG